MGQGVKPVRFPDQKGKSGGVIYRNLWQKEKLKKAPIEGGKKNHVDGKGSSPIA